jgi:hypothetical protein
VASGSSWAAYCSAQNKKIELFVAEGSRYDPCQRRGAGRADNAAAVARDTRHRLEAQVRR